MPELDPVSLPIGTQVGPWRVQGWQGRGSYGTVYRVAREGEEESGWFALKLALQARDGRFEREAALLSRIVHPHVPRLSSHGLWPHPSGTYPYLVMQWVEGGPLYQWAVLQNPTSRQTLRLLAQAARALEATHAAGGVHRDVKGENVLVREADGHAFLTDFGAGDLRGAATLTWQVLPPGTPAYRSPEAWAFQHLFWRHPTARYAASPCDDLFALGVTAYRLVTGQYPPSTQPGEEGAEVWRHGGSGPRPPSELNRHVSPELEALILQLLSVVPMERFRGSARAAAMAIEEAAERAGPAADVPLCVRAVADRFPPREKERSVRVPEQAPVVVELPDGQGIALRAELEHRVVERPVRAEAVIPLARFPGSRPVWLGGAVGIAMGLFLVLGAARWRESPPRAVAHTASQAAQAEESRDGGSVALGDTTSTAPVAAVSIWQPLPGVGLDMPKGPFPRQRKPPCNRRGGEVEVRGGCWYALRDLEPPCEQNAYEWQGGCYLPSYPPLREPTSGQP